MKGLDEIYLDDIMECEYTLPTYAISASPLNIAEGASTTLTVTTTGVPNGTVLNWTVVNRSTVNADFGAVTGQVTITNNTGQFTVNTVVDMILEGEETFQVTLNGLGVTSQVITVGYNYPTSSAYYKYFKVVNFIGTQTQGRLLDYMRAGGYAGAIGFTTDGIEVPSGSAACPAVVYYRVPYTTGAKTYTGSVGSLGGVGSTSGSFFDMGVSNIVDKAQAISTLTEKFQLTAVAVQYGGPQWSPMVFDGF